MTTDKTIGAQIPLVVARGSAAEQGATIGDVTAEKIRAALEIYRRRFRDEVGLTDTDQNRLGNVYGRIISDFSPNTSEMLLAMAESAGVRRESVYLLNARSEILYGSAEQSEADGACTTAAVLGSHTADGRTYLLQNWDWRFNLNDQLCILATEDLDGLQILTLAEVGMTAKAGLNSHGVAVGLNLLASDRNSKTPGVPVHIMLREILRQPRLSAAIRVALQADREGSANVVLASSEHDAIDLELVSDDFAHHLPENGVLTHANHFQTRRGWKDLYAAKAAFSLLRDYRLRRNLNRYGRKLTLARMQEALSDHSSYPDSVCRHVDPGAAAEEQVATLCSLIIDTTGRLVRVYSGNPCEAISRDYSFDKFFDTTHSDRT